MENEEYRNTVLAVREYIVDNHAIASFLLGVIVGIAEEYPKITAQEAIKRALAPLARKM